jgi:hypothetical protein
MSEAIWIVAFLGELFQTRATMISTENKGNISPSLETHFTMQD